MDGERLNKVLKPSKIDKPSKFMMRLTERDVDLLSDIGKAGLMTYRQIEVMHFKSYASCSKRVRKLQSYEYVKGAYYNTSEKVFTLAKEGVLALRDMTGEEYKIEDYNNIYHKLMRAEMYKSVKGYGVTNWKNEVKVPEIDRVFDSYFEYKAVPYFAEVHNTQKSKVLREKMERCLKLPFTFVLVIYCRDKSVVRNLLDKMNGEGFSDNRKYTIKVFEYGEEMLI